MRNSPLNRSKAQSDKKSIRHSHEVQVDGFTHWVSHLHLIDLGDFQHDHGFIVTGGVRVSGLGLVNLERERRRDAVKGNCE